MTIRRVRSRRLAGRKSAAPSRQDYQVGYGKPPEHTRFKKGHSGNRAGRPKRRRDLNTIISEVLQEPVQLRHGERISTVPYLEALFRKLCNSALQGDSKATANLFALLRQRELGTEGYEPEGEQKLSVDDHDLIRNYLERVGGDSPEAPVRPPNHVAGEA